MINIQYVYLTANLVALIPCLYFFIRFKGQRWDMILAGSVLGSFSVFMAFIFWTKDWWAPITIFGGNVGVEDFFLGFLTGCFAVGLNQLFFPNIELSKKKKLHVILITVSFFTVVTSFLFFVLKLHSFWASTITMIIMYTYIYFTKRTSFKKDIFYCIICTVATIPIYLYVSNVNAEWVLRTWKFEMPLKTYVLGYIPVEEFIFWLLFFLMFRPYYLWYANQQRSH